MGFVGVVAEDEADACCVAVEELAASTQSWRAKSLILKIVAFLRTLKHAIF
jgi:hypothetical protein